MTTRDGDQMTKYTKDKTLKDVTAEYDGAGNSRNAQTTKTLDSESPEMKKVNDDKSIERKLNQDVPSELPKLPRDGVSGSGRRQELADAAEVGTRLMSNFDKEAGAIRIAVQEALKATELEARAQKVNLIDAPLNEWNASSPLFSVPVRKIVNEIPHIIALRRSATQVTDKEVINIFAGQYGAMCDVVTDSIAMFTSGADRITYLIDSKGTSAPLSYDPQAPPDPTLKLESFHVTGADGTDIENAASRTSAFSSLMELILKVMKQGDVYIQSPEMVAIGDFEHIDGPLNLLRGKNIPKAMLPHILLGTYAHPLPWFKRDVSEIIPEDEVVVGEFDGVEKCGASDAKKKSNYAVFTDNLFATLHQIFMQEHNAKRANALQYVRSVRFLSYPGSTVRVPYDSEVDLWETYQPDHSDSHRYVLLWLLSPAMREYQYTYLVNLLKNMRGIRAIAAEDRIRSEQSPVDPYQLKSKVDEALLRRTRGYTIDHFYQMMVMEYAHRFIEPLATVETLFTTIQDAIFALLAVAVDALCFPNLFWTNIHIYSYVIYRAWQFVSPRDMIRILAQGYTPTIARVTQLTKQQVRSGEIPRIFTMGAQNLPNNLRAYLAAIDPIGYMEQLQYGNAEWSPNIDPNAEFYIPFTYLRRPKIGSVTHTPFSDQFLQLATVLSALVQQWGQHNGQSRNNTSPILTLLNTLTQWSQQFGSIAHYELNVLYRAFTNGPEIISTSYRGGSNVNIAPMLGIGSTVQHPNLGVPAIDRNHNLYFGIGLWAMTSLMGDQLSVSGTVERSIPTSFQFFDPDQRFVRYSELLQQSKNFAEAFGIMTYLLDGYEDPVNPMQFLVNVFGKSLKAGMANQILTWLLQDMDLKTILNGKLASRDTPFYYDQRFRAPRAAELGNGGEILPARPGQSVYFTQPLDLLNQYTLRKLEVAVETIASENSPIHRYCRELVVRRGLFDYYSPENRHVDPDFFFDYNPRDNTSGFELHGNENKAYFYIGGRRWYSPYEDGFPINVAVRVSNPAEVIEYHWKLLEMAVEFADWQIHFVGMNYLTKVVTVTHDQAGALYERGAMDWKMLKHATIGTVVPITFFDTRSDLINNRTTVFPAGSIQYICATDPVERNVAVRGILGLQPPHSYIPPDHDMWNIGMRRSDDIPMTTNGVPKYMLPVVNFNNFVQVYTANAQLLGTPPLVYLPPRGEDV
nr:MAG: hypothetical protein [brine shrimp reovirus 1]UNI74368.1 MAG: hypothetical protein [brine shrimp reovirus 1]UNI74416.1 MAG: hypothetical protein [brine shrimp reovirus 1]UNI74428.1 MAG: hypothetical protein [brine shrimp reovirus 1]